MRLKDRLLMMFEFRPYRSYDEQDIVKFIIALRLSSSTIYVKKVLDDLVKEDKVKVYRSKYQTFYVFNYDNEELMKKLG